MSQDTAALSLLSLSIAASSASPIPVADSSAVNGSKQAQPQLNHRRLSSTGRRRRLSDARDAAARPSSVGSPVSSMAAMSLSTSPPPPTVTMAASAPAQSSTPIPIANTGPGRKKRGVDHKCETCSKIYRHPSCLIKHRWEHTPHWRALASLPHSAGGAGVLSKHAQVQLLEAAAILSHLDPASDTGTSLPEDRSMWPRWVSGGMLEGEEVSTSCGSAGTSEYGLRGSSGPRLHDYEVPRGAEVRAGVVEVPHAHARVGGRQVPGQGHSVGSAWSVPRSVSVSASVSSEQSRSRSTPSDDEELETEDGLRSQSYGRGGARVWKHEEEEELGFEFDLRGVREEEGEEEEEKGDGPRGQEAESLRWRGMEEMDDIDMDMD
ncbi:hypothetical protein GGX14DRAFT_654591 [Mycena pura]|uniref:C2H2-type domain-containing protein n=1 Tax=Mycena pura TaxID=153505 RepID=A0AAD6Y8F0_9AGAR|nr:hypothetical protein GGX14DRAFT_654591 [Mycena pura]